MWAVGGALQAFAAPHPAPNRYGIEQQARHQAGGFVHSRDALGNRPAPANAADLADASGFAWDWLSYLFSDHKRTVKLS